MSFYPTSGPGSFPEQQVGWEATFDEMVWIRLRQDRGDAREFPPMTDEYLMNFSRKPLDWVQAKIREAREEYQKLLDAKDVELKRDAIRRRMPDATENDVELEFRNEQNTRARRLEQQKLYYAYYMHKLVKGVYPEKPINQKALMAEFKMPETLYKAARGFPLRDPTREKEEDYAQRVEDFAKTLAKDVFIDRKLSSGTPAQGEGKRQQQMSIQPSDQPKAPILLSIGGAAAEAEPMPSSSLDVKDNPMRTQALALGLTESAIREGWLAEQAIAAARGKTMDQTRAAQAQLLAQAKPKAKPSTAADEYDRKLAVGRDFVNAFRAAVPKVLHLANPNIGPTESFVIVDACQVILLGELSDNQLVRGVNYEWDETTTRNKDLYKLYKLKNWLLPRQEQQQQHGPLEPASSNPQEAWWNQKVKLPPMERPSLLPAQGAARLVPQQPIVVRMPPEPEEKNLPAPPPQQVQPAAASGLNIVPLPQHQKRQIDPQELAYRADRLESMRLQQEAAKKQQQQQEPDPKPEVKQANPFRVPVLPVRQEAKPPAAQPSSVVIPSDRMQGETPAKQLQPNLQFLLQARMEDKETGLAKLEAVRMWYAPNANKLDEGKIQGSKAVKDVHQLLVKYAKDTNSKLPIDRDELWKQLSVIRGQFLVDQKKKYSGEINKIMNTTGTQDVKEFEEKTYKHLREMLAVHNSVRNYLAGDEFWGMIPHDLQTLFKDTYAAWKPYWDTRQTDKMEILERGLAREINATKLQHPSSASI